MDSGRMAAVHPLAKGEGGKHPQRLRRGPFRIIALAWAVRAEVKAFIEWTIDYLVVVRKLAAGGAGAAAKSSMPRDHLNQKLSHKITKIPPSVVMAPASNGRFDAHSLLTDSDADWRRTWTRDICTTETGEKTVALVPHGAVDADDVIAAGRQVFQDARFSD